MKSVTLVITTHNRTDLLEKTLITFFKYNTYPIKKVVIVEDSGILQNFNNINI
jgi:GT2 family glycosyltransferase